MENNKQYDLMIDSTQPGFQLHHHAKEIEKVLRYAVREALLMHRRAGNPVAVWRNGKVVWLEASEALNGLNQENKRHEELI